MVCKNRLFDFQTDCKITFNVFLKGQSDTVSFLRVSEIGSVVRVVSGLVCVRGGSVCGGRFVRQLAVLGERKTDGSLTEQFRLRCRVRKHFSQGQITSCNSSTWQDTGVYRSIVSL